MLDKSTTQRLRSLPVEAVAERLGLRVVRHKSLCPFHDDHHASLSYSTSRNTFRCFVCDARGGTIDLVMRHLNMSFPDACRWLANGTNIILDTYRPRTPTADRPARPFDAARYARLFEHPWLSDEARTFLFTERRLNPRVVSWCRLTSWTDRQGTHWLQTPYFDASGQLIASQITPRLLANISRIDLSALEKAGWRDTLTALSDVEASLTGPGLSALDFLTQKGASPEEAVLIAGSLRRFAMLAARCPPAEQPPTAMR